MMQIITTVLIKIGRLEFSDFVLLFKIFWFLHLAKWYIEFKDLKSIIIWIKFEDLRKNLIEEDWKYARKVAHYTQLMARIVPFESKCYDKALTVKKILNKKKIPSILMMGVKINDVKKMEAHAWIQVKDRQIIGGEIANQYVLVNSFI